MTRRSPTADGFRDYLWDLIPEARERILGEEMGEVEHDGSIGLNAYRHMSMAFMHALREATERDDIALVRRGVAMVEEMLAADDDFLTDVVHIRVFDKTGHDPGLTEHFCRYAGPLTWRCLVAYHGDFPQPEHPATIGDLPPDGRPGPEAAAVRDWLWRHVPLSRVPLLTVEWKETRATMTLAAMTPERYIAEAVMWGMLREGLEEWVKGHPDQELTEAAAAELELMIADPGMAALLRPHAAELAAEAERNPLLASYAGPLLRAFMQG